MWLGLVIIVGGYMVTFVLTVAFIEAGRRFGYDVTLIGALAFGCLCLWLVLRRGDPDAGLPDSGPSRPVGTGTLPVLPVPPTRQDSTGPKGFEVDDVGRGFRSRRDAVLMVDQQTRAGRMSALEIDQHLRLIKERAERRSRVH